MAEYCDGEVIFFAAEGPFPAISEHLAKAGRAVLVTDGKIVLCTGADEIVLLKLASIPVSTGECNQSQLENVMAAVAAAWALGVSLDLIRAGIATFEVERAAVSAS